MYDNDDSFEFPDDSSSDLNSAHDVTSTAIIMVSPPETSDDDDPICSSSTNNNRASQDVFQTPPEDSDPPTSDGITPLAEVDRSGDDDDRPYEDAGDGRGVTTPSGDAFTDGPAAGAVDLGRDTDQGFSDAETMEVAGFIRESARERGRVESPLKKLRVSENELAKSDLQAMDPQSHGCSSGKSLEIEGADEKSSEEGSKVRKLDSSEDESGSCVEKSESDSEEEESIEDIIKRIPNVSIEELCRMERLWMRRKLPPSISGQAGSSAMDGKEGKKEEVCLLDVLKLLKDKHNGDGNGNDEIGKCSFLEISRRRGMTFPQPAWWPKGGFGSEEGSQP